MRSKECLPFEEWYQLQVKWYEDLFALLVDNTSALLTYGDTLTLGALSEEATLAEFTLRNPQIGYFFYLCRFPDKCKQEEKALREEQ